MAEDFEKRQGKLEDAIAKLADISADLNKMLAVHELRITQQEKITDSLEYILEKRRDEIEEKEKHIYSKMKQEDDRIIDKIEDSHEKLSKKIGDLEKMIWVYGGGFSVLAFIVANWSDVIKIVLK